MTGELVDKCWLINCKRTARLICQEGLQGHRRRGQRSLTKPDDQAPPIPNLVGLAFRPPLLDTMWCGDITYIRNGQSWLYLATAIDLAARRSIDWSMGTRHDASLVVVAFEMAVVATGTHDGRDTILYQDPVPPRRFGLPAGVWMPPVGWADPVLPRQRGRRVVLRQA